MLYNFVADSFHTKKLCSRSHQSVILHRKRKQERPGRRTMFILGSLESA